MSDFFNNFRNFIFYRKLQATGGSDSIVIVNETSLIAFKFDQTKAALSGTEATVDIHPYPLDWLHVQNTFSYVVGKLKDPVESARYLPFISATRLNNRNRGETLKKSITISGIFI